MSEWIEINLPFNYNEKFEDTDDYQKVFDETFVGKGLANPGTLIELEDGDVLLIGDINKNRGRCDCCSVSGYKIVKRYKVVWKPE